MKKILIIILGILFFINLILATSVGTSEMTKGRVVYTPTIIINYSLVPTVNSSDYWDNLDIPLASWLSTYNSTYHAKADYQFLNNNFNGSGNFITTGTGTFGNIGGNLIPDTDNAYDLGTGFLVPPTPSFRWRNFYLSGELNFFELTHNKTTTIIPRINSVGGGTITIDTWGTSPTVYIQGPNLIGLNQDVRVGASPTFQALTVAGNTHLKVLEIGDDAPTAGEWALDVAPATLDPRVGSDGADGKGVNIICADGQASQYAGTSGNAGSVNIKIGVKGIGLDGADDGEDGIFNVTGGEMYLGSPAKQSNLTMYSSDGSPWSCGVNNAGVFSCG